MTRLDRRRALALLAGAPMAISLAACTAGAAKVAPPRPDADARIRWRAQRAEQYLLALHAATVAAHPDLAAALEPLAANHAVHLAAVEADGGLPPGAPGIAPPAAPEIAADPGAALTAVRDAERSASEAGVAGCLAATGPVLAALLASVAAAEAAHARHLESA